MSDTNRHRRTDDRNLLIKMRNSIREQDERDMRDDSVNEDDE